MASILHDPLTRFIAQAATVIVVSRLIGLVTRRLGQPLVIAEMIGGILLGPSLLGWVAPGLSAELFAPESFAALKLVSQFGVILFMFLVGLELDPKLFRGSNWISVVISQSGIFVPFVLGGTLAVWMYPQFSNATVSRTAFVLFMGAAMSITAFPVLARILTERRLLTTRIGAIAITCAAIDDVTAWCILAFVVGVARHHDLSDSVVSTISAVVFFGFMIGIVRPLLARFIARVRDPEKPSQPMIAFLIVLLLLSSMTTELIGIHAVFGGFLFGAILPKDRGFSRALGHRMEGVVVIVLLPLFFASSGLYTQLGLLSSASDWLVCGLVVLIACAGKLGGCAVAARAIGLPWRDAGALGLLMNTRGLVELIVLNIGRELGVISPVVFSMMVIMALVTTVATTPLLRWTIPESQRGQQDEPAVESE